MLIERWFMLWKISVIKLIEWHVWWTVSLSTQPSLSFLDLPMNTVDMVAEVGEMHGIDNRDFHSPMLTWLQLLPSVRSAYSRDQHWAPDMAPFPEGTSQRPGNRVTTLDPFLHGMDIALSLLEYILNLIMDLSSLMVISCPNYQLLTYRIPYPCTQFFIQYCFWPRILLHSQRIATVGISSWNSLVLPCSPRSWSRGHDRTIEWPFFPLFFFI